MADANELPPKILKEGAETYKSKNKDYGASWQRVGEILHLLADGEDVVLETREDHISYGLFTRRLDKLARGFHGEFLADEVNHEPVVDAHKDEMTYSAMQASNQLDRANESESPPLAGLAQRLWNGARDVFS